jgi:hypothetical protein
MEPILSRAEKKSAALGVGSIEKQWASLAAFVGIPLPGTGAWTGAMGAFLLGMPTPVALSAIFTGVVATAYTAQVERREALYEMELREILADGVVTEEEQERLKSMQAKFGMTDAQVESLIEQMEEEKRLSGTHASS